MVLAELVGEMTMTCYRHEFQTDSDHPNSGLCDCGKRYDEHPVNEDYENMRLAEEMLQDEIMESEYQVSL